MDEDGFTRVKGGRQAKKRKAERSPQPYPPPGANVCSLLEWCFIISIGVSSDHSQLKCTGFAGTH